MIKLYLFALSFLMSIASFSQSYNMKLLGIWTDSTLPTNSGGYTFSEVFGFVMKGKEYAVIGSTQGTHIIDVSNPSNPVEIDFVPARYQGNVTHRDFDVHNNHLYMVCDQATSSLQIADLTHLPDSVKVVYDSNNLIVRSHNIFIDSSQDLLYSCGGNKLTGSNELRILNISNPLSPALVVDLADDIPWWSSFVGYVHDIYVKDNLAFTNDADAMHIINFANPMSPVILGTLSSYSDKGYNHSGYLHNDDTTYVMCDETHGKRVKFMDVSDPASILVTDLEGTALPNSTQIAHNPIIKGNYAYVSYYYDGVQVYDIGDKYNVTNIAYYDTYQGPNAGGGEGCWGVYPLLPSGIILASDRRKGLFVLEHLTPPAISMDTNRSTFYESGGLQTVYVNLSNCYDDTVYVTVDIDTASTATLNIDYTLASIFPVQLKFEPGTVIDSFQYMLVDNIEIESTETLIFKLSNAVNGDVSTPSTDTIFILDNDFTGVDEKLEEVIILFPNPVLQGNKVMFSELVTYQVIDATGKLVSTATSNFISTKRLSKGVYFVNFNNRVEKLIIE